MPERTIREVCEATGLNRFTLQQVASKGVIPARRAGSIWMIDTETAAFQTWLEAHWKQPRVRRGKKRHSS